MTPEPTKVLRPEPSNENDDPQGMHLRDHVRAIHRIWGLLYPDTRIRYVLKALATPIGNPESVRINFPPPARDYGGSDSLGVIELGGRTDAPVGLTVVAGVPKAPTSDDPTDHEKTNPEFRNPVVQTAATAAPVLFEQAKFAVERYWVRRRDAEDSLRSVARGNGGFRLEAPEDGRDTSKAPAILVAFHWLEIGGAEKLALDCVRWARAEGLRVIVVAEKPEVQRLARLLPDDGRVEFIRTDAYLPARFWPSFIEAIVRSENVRALHIHHSVRAYEALPQVKALFPDVMVIDSTHVIEHRNAGFVQLSGVWANYIDHQHVISRHLSDYLGSRFGAARNVVLGRMLNPEDRAKAHAPVSFSLEEVTGELRLVFVGRLVHQKRAPLVIGALARLVGWAHRKKIRLHLDMVGTGAYLGSVKKMIARHGLSEIVTLHPADADVPGLMKQAHILLLPSSNEGLALVCYEAIEHGAIPISTDVGGQSELLPRELLVPASPSRSIRSTVSTICRLVEDRDFRALCAGKLRKNYSTLRSEPTAEEVIRRLYAECAGKDADQ